MPSGIYLIIFWCTINQKLPMNLIKSSHFTETKIYFKIDPKVAKTLIIQNLVPFIQNGIKTNS